jgi:hypothetical protein
MAAVTKNPVSKKDGITVIIAMDGSEFADYALKCKYFVFTFFVCLFYKEIITCYIVLYKSFEAYITKAAIRGLNGKHRF